MIKDKKNKKVREYTVKFKQDGKTISNTFTNLKVAREFARQTYRDGSYVAFHNIKKIPLCL